MASALPWKRSHRSKGKGNARRGAQRGKGSAQQLENSRALQFLGRFGDVCYGVVHLVVAWLALQVAFGSHQEADQQGAVTTIAAQPFGAVLLWLLAIGLIAFGLWQLLAAAVSFQWISPEGKRTRKRLGVAGRALAVLGIASFTVKLLASGQKSGSSNTKPQELTASLMSLPAGRILVGIAGLVVLGFAANTAWRGIKRKFTEDWDTNRLSGKARRTAELVGSVGFVAKGVAFGIVGALIGYAGFTHNAAEAGGLDKALKTLAAQPFGMVLLVVVALGFVAFAGYLFADARARRG
jgi:hypothetical protein